MRHDIPNKWGMFPLKWFTWGYMLMDSRWYPYWVLKLPGYHWKYSIANDEYKWCDMILMWRRGRGLEVRFTPKE
jgi:hypothetical protein